MRVLLDEHLSPRHIGKRLEAHGHDVAVVSDFSGALDLDDEPVLTLATEEDRIFVSGDSVDVAPLAGKWSELGRRHAGIVIVWSHLNHEFLGVADGVHRVLAANPDHATWQGLVVGV